MEPFVEKLHGNISDVNPKLSSIMEHLQDYFGNYKYTVYRCAVKIVALQKAFHTTSIPYKLVQAVFERHGIQERADIDLMVPPFQLTALIHDIYFACEKLGHFTKVATYNLEASTSLLANFFWDIYDPQRRHSISQLELKVTFLIMCKLYSSDKVIGEFYNVVCDFHKGCVSKYAFQYFLKTLIKLFTYVGEGNAYGAHNTNIAMEQCFARHFNTVGLTEHQFYCLWSTSQTRFLIYANLIALIKRIEDTEKLIHNNACASCRCERIVGIRFKCQNCKNISLCLKCFATGYTTQKHEAGHRMYEVFAEDVQPKRFNHFISKLRWIFCNTGRSDDTTSFCNSHEASAANETEMITFETNRSVHSITNKSPGRTNHVITSESKSNLEPSIAVLSTAASNASHVSERLQTIIDKLMQQNMKLEDQLKSVQNASTEDISVFLSSHQKFLIEIINEMRNFSKNTSSISSYPTSSTPNRSICAKRESLGDSYINSGGGQLTHSIYGADLNRSYLEANKSDYSINDLSLWFNQRRLSATTRQAPPKPLSVLLEAADDFGMSERDTEMTNFRLLLTKVKEIVEDSYSDNTELSEATQNLENVLDSIIINEESKRRST